ncbi:MAG: hypothetical protein ACXWZM_06975 [Solirubrobacterales bacterium]
MDEYGCCSVCARTPLVGEQITVMQTGNREAVVCDQCLGAPRAQALGEPSRRERVRSAAGAANVARIYPRPVPAGPPRRPSRAGAAA